MIDYGVQMASRPTPFWPRHIAETLRSRLADSRVVVLTGPRQIGKTTLTRQLSEERDGTYVTLDDPGVLSAASADPSGFLDRRAPLVIDEFQWAGDPLLRAIKAAVDRDPRPGRFVLTGSTHFLTVPTLSESLAGRVALVEMGPLTQGELRGVRERFVDRLFDGRTALLRAKPERLARRDYAGPVAVGGYPGVVPLAAGRRRRTLLDLAQTVTARDVVRFASIHGVARLRTLLQLLAARTGQELNVTAVASELGAVRQTTDAYLDLLETVYLVARVPAWSRHPRGRVVRHPKLHLVDSGFACALLGVDATALAEPDAPMAGPLLETFVAGELSRQLAWAGTEARLHHFRHHDGGEVDLVLETPDGRIAGVEVKAAASVRGEDFRGFRDLAAAAGKRFVSGAVLYLGEESLPFGDRLCALPVSALWAR
jgi:predicted AAA+ superfamily ATPase